MLKRAPKKVSFYYGENMENIKKIKCPFCNYEMPIWYDEKESKSKGVFVKCKGRNCKKEFEIKINVK